MSSRDSPLRTRYVLVSPMTVWIGGLPASGVGILYVRSGFLAYTSSPNGGMPLLVSLWGVAMNGGMIGMRSAHPASTMPARLNASATIRCMALINAWSGAPCQERCHPFGPAKKWRQLLGAEHAQRLLVAEDARHPALDEPFGAAPREKPAVEADPIDVGRFGRMKIDTGVSGRDRAVTVEADHEGAHLVGAAADHRLMALAVDQGAHRGASLHPADVDVVHAVVREDRGRAVGVARVRGEAVAHDDVLDRQLVLERLNPAGQLRDRPLDVGPREPVP